MAKKTFLEIVQRVLNDMSEDQVNSWSDTIASEQVGYIVASTFDNIIANRDWPHTRKLVDFEASGTMANPTHVRLPDNVKRVVSISYNTARLGDTRKLYRPVRYIEPDDFLRIMNGRNTDDPRVDSIVDPTGVQLYIYNYSHPQYVTSFDDSTLVFDSYDAAVDSTIQESKIQAIAYVIPTFQMNDDYIPDLPLEAFPALIEESISRAQLKLNQLTDAKSEEESRRQQRWLSRNAWRVAGGIKTPDYGRRGRHAPVLRNRKDYDY